jgi:hypothetical protein
LLRSYSSEIVEYLQSKNINIDVKTAPDLLKYLTENSELFSLDWKDFTFKPFSLPAINTFHMDNVLQGYFDQDMIGYIRNYFDEYYDRHFTSNVFWLNPNSVNIMLFFANTFNLYYLFLDCVKLFNTFISKEEEKRIKERILEYLKGCSYNEYFDELLKKAKQ